MPRLVSTQLQSLRPDLIMGIQGENPQPCTITKTAGNAKGNMQTVTQAATNS